MRQILSDFVNDVGLKWLEELNLNVVAVTMYLMLTMLVDVTKFK